MTDRPEQTSEVVPTAAGAALAVPQAPTGAVAPGQAGAVPILSYAPAAPAMPSPWSPLRVAIFRSLWIASLVSLIGTWAQEAGGPWLMGLMTTDKGLISSVTAFGSLALGLFSLPAGVMADLLDRRRFLIVTHLWRLAAAVALGALTFYGLVTPGLLLTFTFVLYLGAAFSGPAFQYLLPELVPPSQLPLAIGLNSVALNVARAIGPALGMALVAIAGRGVTAVSVCFVFNGLTCLGVAWVLLRWRPEPRKPRPHPERFLPALRSGLRYTLHAHALHSILIRVFAFISCASCLWGLMVPLAKNVLGGGDLGYGTLMAFLGVGAVAGVFAMPHLQRRLDTEGMVAACTAMFAAGMCMVGLSRSFALDCVLMVFLGANWVIVPTSFNTATQQSVPQWVKGRAISMYMAILFLSLALARFWGWVAQTTSVPTAFLLAGAGLAAGLLLVRRFPLTAASRLDHRPGGAAATTTPTIPGAAPHPDDGPVLVSTFYEVAPTRAGEFTAVMRRVRVRHLRDGATHWHLFAMPDAPGRFVEQFTVDTWADVHRHGQRLTRADAAHQDEAGAMHVGDGPPRMAYWISAHAEGRDDGPAGPSRVQRARRRWRDELMRWRRRLLGG